MTTEPGLLEDYHLVGVFNVAAYLGVATIDTIDPAAPTAEEVAALEAHTAALETLGDAILVLSPTEHGWVELRESIVADFVAPVARAHAAEASLHAAVLSAEAGDVVSPPFGLLGATLGMFSTSYIRVDLTVRIYGPVIDQLDQSINNLILMGIIDYFAPAGADGPEITWVLNTSSTAWVIPGYDTTIFGNSFDADPAMTMFIIVGTSWQEAAEALVDGCGIEDGDTLPEIIEDIESCAETVEDAIDDSIHDATSSELDGVLGERAIEIGPFPDVCGSGWVPVTIGIMPINLATGQRGDFFVMNCLP